MDPVKAAKAKLLAALHGKPGFSGLGIGMDHGGNPELQVLWLRGIVIPPFPSSVDDVPIVIRIIPPIVPRNETVSGFWDRFKGEAADAWAEYRQTLHELYTGRE